MKLKIGVMGRSENKLPPKLKQLAYEVGRQVALHNCILVNGACYGVPYECARGAQAADGFVVGISPAKNMTEHVQLYKFPTNVFDMLVFSGFGFKGRNVLNVSTSDIVLVVDGAIGTLNEFTIAYDEGKVIGVLLGSGGIAEHLKHIVEIAEKETGAVVIYEHNPHQLVANVIKAYRRHRDKNPVL